MAPRCLVCKMDFSKPANLRAHVKRKHPDKLDVLAPVRPRAPSGSSNHNMCEECGKSFVSFGNLRCHVKQKHSDKLDKLAPLNRKVYKCKRCDAQFQLLKRLSEHIKNAHSVTTNSFKCPMCQYTGTSRDVLLKHYKEEHSIEISFEKLEFESLERFQVWKSAVERETFASFVKISGSKSIGKSTKISYYCHRSGKSRTRGNKIRQFKAQGSNKIGGYCPAKITVNVKRDKCLVQFCKSHVGHKQEQDIGHLSLTKTDREKIAAKIAAKVPLQTIVDEIRDSTSNSNLERLHLLTRKDLYNIQRCFKLNRSSERHANEAVSVEAWINELERSDSVLFYKPQAIACEEHPQLNTDDFVLIIMTECQKELLLNYGHDTICVDNTHGLNGYGFQLSTILIVDDLREGYPCAFLISNRGDLAILHILFSYVEDKINKKIRPRIFMSDMAETYYNAWVQVMHPAELRLYCTWHVDRAWSENLEKVANQEKKAIIYRMLQMLLQETDVCTFKKLLSKFLKYCKESSDTLEFARYFEQHFTSKPEQWSNCFRLNGASNTNVHLERMHRTIDHLYLNAKFVKRLDKAIGAIMQFIRDKLFERLIVLYKGKECSKLRNRHKRSESLNLDTVVQDNTSWIVKSSSSKEKYVVEEIKSDCTCKLICKECNACIHRYICTCLDSCVFWNMCKHVHLVCRFIQRFPQRFSEEDMLSAEDVSIGLNTNDEEFSSLDVLSEHHTQRQLSERKDKLIQILREELLACKSLEELEAVEQVLAPLKSTLAAVRNQQKSINMTMLPVVRKENFA